MVPKQGADSTVGRAAHSSINLYVGPSLGYSYGLWPGGGAYFGYGGLGIPYMGPGTAYLPSGAAYPGYYYLPPTYARPELAYGPLATERFLGVRRVPPASLPPGAARSGAAAGDLDSPETEVPDAAGLGTDDARPDSIASKLRHSNEAARERARRFLSFGDALFERQRFHEAWQRYKSAIEAAPDLPEAYFREGFALIAVNQYRLAARALRIGVELDPDLPGGTFQVDQLYKENQLAKSSHLERLSGEALEQPTNGDLLFLVGMFLYCDGSVERGQKFLRRAAELGGAGAAFITPLLESETPGELPAVAPAATEIDI